MIEPSADALWVGRRLGAIMAPGHPGLAETLSWCEERVRQGHMCLDFDECVVDEDGREDRLPREWIEELKKLPWVAEHAVGSLNDSMRPLVVEGSRLYFAAQRADEITIAQRLVTLSRRPSCWVGAASAQGAGDALQAAAIDLITKASLAIVIGGPGTGKTTVARGMVECVLRHEPSTRVLLLAPTGKATARLRESINSDAPSSAPAMTIHRALTAAAKSTLLAARLVVVDEASMVPAQLMRRLLEAMSPEASLVLLGDAHQLASIESGCVLADIVPDSKAHPLHECTVSLTKNWRFNEVGALGALASAVNAGDWARVEETLHLGGPVSWIDASSSSMVVEHTLECRATMGDGSSVLCAHRRGRDGSLAIAREMARGAGGGANIDPIHGRDFDGRPIIITVNDPATDLVNGDVGRVEERNGRLVAVFQSQPDKAIEVERLPRHEAAYAITIHRSQGSEYDGVVIALPASVSPVLSRELLYTAITRARTKVAIVSSEASLRAAVARQVRRASGLRERIEAAGMLPPN